MTSLTAKERAEDSGVSKLRFSAWAGIFVFGIVMAILGAILPSLVDRFGFSASMAGSLFLTMNFGMLVTTLSFGPLVDRFGFKALLAVSALLVAGAFLLLARASSYGLVLAAAGVLGLGGGGLNGGANALTSDIHEGEKRGAALNILGIFFGFGALSIPFLIGTLRELLGLRWILQLATLLSLVPFIIYVVLRFPKAKQARGFPIREAAAIVRDPLLWLCAFLLFFQSGNEFTVGGWISSYLQRTFGLGAGPAAMVLAGYWAALMAGRLLSARLIRMWGGGKLVLLSAGLAFAAAALLRFSPSGPLAAVAAGALGFGFAAIYPTTLAVVGERFPAFTGTAFSVAIAVGLVGGMISPWLAGTFAQSAGLRAGLTVPLFNCAMVFFLQLILVRSPKAPREDIEKHP